MSKARVFISKNRGVVDVRVTGRATFECSPPLRTIVNNIDSEQIDKVRIDLADCSGMDSTFMGILSMLAMKLRAKSKKAEIAAAGEYNTKLLNGLGLKKLFNYTSKPVSQDEKKWTELSRSSDGDTAITVLEAHEKLMEADKKNVDKFGNVVELVREDIRKKNGD